MIDLPFNFNLPANLIFTPIRFCMRNLPPIAVDLLIVWLTILCLAIAIWPQYRWVCGRLGLTGDVSSVVDHGDELVPYCTLDSLESTNPSRRFSEHQRKERFVMGLSDVYALNEKSATADIPSDSCPRPPFKVQSFGLSDRGKARSSNEDCFPADPLFVSAAAFYGEGTIGIVLTGYGVDGSHGVEAVRKMGGYVIAQEPSTSEAPSMPNAAINTGCVDVILPLQEIGPALLDLLRG